MNINNTLASLLQETWFPSTQLSIQREGKTYHFVSAGHDNTTSHGMILSPLACKAWQAEGRWMKCFGPNITALKIKIRAGAKSHNRARRTKLIYLVSGYSPCNPDRRIAETKAYLKNLQECIQHCQDHRTILIMGTDTNVSFGTNRDRASEWPTTGKYGIPASGKYQQKTATKFQNLLTLHNLCLATTFPIQIQTKAS